jgi:hypothetical protein
MNRYKELNFKLDKIELLKCFSLFSDADYNYDNIIMYKTLGVDGCEYVNNFVSKVTNALDCISSRECFTFQKDDSDNVPIHIDICDYSNRHKIHRDYYSIVVPISGIGTTSFYHCNDNFDNTFQRRDYVFENTEIAKIGGVKIKDTPYVLNIQEPHSVEVIKGPRITYHMKISKVKHNIQTIQKILNDTFNGR